MMFQVDCNFRCWECTHMCEMIQLFRLPEADFNKTILDSLKSRAGMLIAQNYDYAAVKQNLMATAVTIKISRELFLEKYHF